MAPPRPSAITRPDVADVPTWCCLFMVLAAIAAATGMIVLVVFVWFA